MFNIEQPNLTELRGKLNALICRLQSRIRKSSLWAFDGKNYEANDNRGELSAYLKKQPITFAIPSATSFRNLGKRNLIISSNAMVDDNND